MATRLVPPASQGSLAGHGSSVNPDSSVNDAFHPDSSVAVIDIGSNSVRMVVFDGPLRAPLAKFNEKVLCGLGKSLALTGEIDAQAAQAALQTLRRFSALARKMGVSRTRTVATAAVREATNGPEFVRRVEEQCGLTVEVLSGLEEARLSACGVLSGIPDADGIVGDIGGGSLELVNLQGGEIRESVTLPLGALRLFAEGLSEKALIERIDEHLQAVPWLGNSGARPLYVVGGAWRAIAKIHIKQRKYPLAIIHQYALDAARLDEVMRLLVHQSQASLSKIPGLSGKRVETMKIAALVLARLIARTHSRSVVFSSYGLREGILFDELPDDLRRLDPFIEACKNMAVKEGRFPEHGDELVDWIEPLFASDDGRFGRLRLAAAMLSDIGWGVHPDYRAGQAFRRILRAPFTAVDHRERAIVALAVYVRYNGNPKGAAAASGRNLLDDADIIYATRLGLALRSAHTLSGGAYGLLGDSSLKVQGKYLTLEGRESCDQLMGEVVERRLASLAKAFGLKARISHAGD